MAAPSPVADPQAVEDTVRGVLTRPEFVGLEEHWYDPILGFVQDPIGTIVGWVEWVLFRLIEGSSQSTVAWVIAIVVALLIAAAVYFLTRSVRSDERVAVVAASLFNAQSSKELRDRAEAAVRDGQLDNAIRFYYGALLVTYSERGLLRLRDGRTTGEYARDAQEAAPGAFEEFSVVTATFERVWYGDQSATQDDISIVKAASLRALQGSNA